jgi:hypothetical protein
MTPSELAQYYTNLLIMEYFGLPLARGTVEAYTTQAIADMIVMQVRAGFNLDSATGLQLDAIGQLIGVQRSVPGFTPGTPEFSMPEYSDVDAGTYVGFARYDDNPVPDGFWPRYNDSPTQYIMTDSQFAQFIRFIVAVRASDYSLKSLADIFFAFFGDLVVIDDNLDMTMTYTHDATNDTSPLFAILDYLGLLPHPAGVEAVVVTI